nr:retrovirus-related Pol polyprotein from transposon TNT 1-94 [Tanacetum cinerariifolium]
MSTLAKFMIVVGADNRPPMLDKQMYELWKSRMELYIQGKEHEWIILNSVKNGPLIWPTVEQENGTVRPKTYEELSNKEKIQTNCDLKATNIVFQGLPPDVYSLVNHHKVSKEIWDRVKLFMQGTSLSKQEHKCKMYGEFGKFSHVKGETLYEYYLQFAQLINYVNIIQMTMQLVQVNTKFLNSLPPEWDACDSDCNDIASAKAVLMANLSSYDSVVLFEDMANNKSKIVTESLTVELERYKKRVKILKQRFNVDLSSREKFIDSQMDDMIQMKNTKRVAFETEIDTLKQTLSKHAKEKESLLTISKPTGNTKNNRISQSSSINKTNKLEDQSRSVKSRTNKKNLVSKTKCNVDVIYSILNANSKSVCAICNECLFDVNHDKCVLDYVHDVNVLSKSKHAKRKNKKQIWKPTCKVYTGIAYKWKPTGRTFTMVENKCPLTSTRATTSFSNTCFPPMRIDWDTLFQLLFDEYFSPPSSVDHPVPKVVASELVVSTGTPSSISVDQDA